MKRSAVVALLFLPLLAAAAPGRTVTSSAQNHERDAEPLADTFRRDAVPLADTFKRDAEPLSDTFKRSVLLDADHLEVQLDLPMEKPPSSRTWTSTSLESRDPSLVPP